jgi:hypothetical protein
MVFALARHGVIAPASAQASYQINEKSLNALDLVRKRLKEGFPSAEILPALDTILADLDAAEQAGLIGLSDPEAAAKFREVLFASRFALTSVRAVVIAAQEPEFERAEAMAKGAVRERRQPGWWVDVALVAQNLLVKLFEQSRMSADRAWADADTLSEALRKANAQRIQ